MTGDADKAPLEAVSETAVKGSADLVGGRVPQPVADIDSAQDLLRYALSAQLDQVMSAREHLSERRIAKAAKMGTSLENAGAALSGLLRGRTTLTVPMLQRLDKAIGAMMPTEETAGQLSSLAVRLSGRQQDVSGLIAVMPAAWDRQLMWLTPTTEIGVLNQASALVSHFQTADRMDSGKSVEDVLGQHRSKLQDLVTRLIMIAVGPPTSFNIDAQILLGSLVHYAPNPLLTRLDHELRKGPLGFRVWRVITKLIKLTPHEGPRAGRVAAWVDELLRDADRLRRSSLYPGRSLDLELAITIPAPWSPHDGDWVGTVLTDRALNDTATIRERGTAALGLWQRALSSADRDPEAVKATLRPLMEEFKNGRARPDAVNGMRWVAASLEYLTAHDRAVCNDWSEIDHPWMHPWIDQIDRATDEIRVGRGVPAHLVEGTRRLFTHALLQNAGVIRRQAIETLSASGLTKPVARALGRVLENETTESWLRIRALFALSFLGKRDSQVEETLTTACVRAYENLNLDSDARHGAQAGETGPPRAKITELHAVLFAIGDCFGVPSAAQQAAEIHETLADILNRLVTDRTHSDSMHQVARATAYMLTVTAQPGPNDLSRKLLERLRTHRDATTRNLSSWALKVRYTEDGTVQPLIAAPHHAPPRS